jgi:hypothetical protein
VSFVCVLVHRIAGLASPELRRHASPLSAILRHPRRTWSHRDVRHSLLDVLVRSL